jgi:hypothetical protein
MFSFWNITETSLLVKAFFFATKSPKHKKKIKALRLTAQSPSYELVNITSFWFTHLQDIKYEGKLKICTFVI